MKSVGEVMSIGRSFNEALQKACQSLENNSIGLGADGKPWRKTEDIINALKRPSWDRIFRIKDALLIGMPIKSIHELTKIDPWYIMQIYQLVKLEKELLKYEFENVPSELFKLMKQNGFSDKQIANLLKVTEEEVYQKNHSASLI
jgi:carbamoyl-phosphate synthase large subunit